MTQWEFIECDSGYGFKLDQNDRRLFIDYSSTWHWEIVFRPEVISWLETNAGGHYRLEYDDVTASSSRSAHTSRFQLYFKDRKTAVHFKLVWA
jgi:hypothetical protein